MKTMISQPRHLVWSVESIDIADPFQRRWLLQQTLIHGTADDIRRLDLEKLAQEIDCLQLPMEIERLWRAFMKTRHG